MNEVLHNPPYAPSWIVREAQANRIDGAVILMPRAAAHASASGKRLHRCRAGKLASPP